MKYFNVGDEVRLTREGEDSLGALKWRGGPYGKVIGFGKDGLPNIVRQGYKSGRLYDSRFWELSVRLCEKEKRSCSC